MLASFIALTALAPVADFQARLVRPFTNGLEVEMTRPLYPGMGLDPADYSVLQGTATVPVQSVTLSRDRKKIFLETAKPEAGTAVTVRFNKGLSSADDQPLTAPEIVAVVSSVAARRYRVAPVVRPLNALTRDEQREGFQLLFDGKSTNGWSGWARDTMPTAWKVVDGAIQLQPGQGGGGDIMTVERYGDFDLRLEWKVSPGGNSGIFFRSVPPGAPYSTGPEMQILDDARHPDGRNPLTSAGSNYAMHAPKRTTVRPPDTWNEVRILAKGDDVRFWMNGYPIVSFTFGSEEWDELFKKSKFAGGSRFGKEKAGHIVLQDHGNVVAFRNVRIKKL